MDYDDDQNRLEGGQSVMLDNDNGLHDGIHLF
jgi:hypothetical protein